MSNTPRNLTRNQLAEFLPNARAVRAFEQLLKSVGELLPSDVATLNRLIQESSIEGATASAKAQQAIDSLESIAHSLELLTGRSDNAHNATETDYLDLLPGSPAGEKVGRLKWGPTGTLEVSMGGGNIIQQVGEEIFVYGKASGAITEGQLIMVTGSIGASGVLTFAPTTTGLTDPNAILGVATENLAVNAFGRVTIIGIVHGINTTGASVGETWADGDVLWYNPSFVGAMTKVKPSAPNMKTQVAIVINAGSGGSGSLQVEVLHGSTLGGTDSNVQLGALADKQLIQYDSAVGYWKNVAASSIAEAPISAGTTAQYWRGDKTWQDLFTQVRAATLTGLSTITNAVITAADTVLSALGKLQKQISDNLTTLTTHTGASSGVHGVTGSVVGTTDTQTLTSKSLGPATTVGNQALATNELLRSVTGGVFDLNKVFNVSSFKSNGAANSIQLTLVRQSGLIIFGVTDSNTASNTAGGMIFVRADGAGVITASVIYQNGWVTVTPTSAGLVLTLTLGASATGYINGCFIGSAVA